KDRLVADLRRQNALVNAGYHILRFTATDLRTPRSVAAQVRLARSLLASYPVRCSYVKPLPSWVQRAAPNDPAGGVCRPHPRAGAGVSGWLQSWNCRATFVEPRRPPPHRRALSA